MNEYQIVRSLGSAGKFYKLMSVKVTSRLSLLTTEDPLGTSREKGQRSSSKNKAGLGLLSSFPKNFTGPAPAPLLKRRD